MAAAVVLDTNVIIRHLLGDHLQLSARADELFEPIITGTLRALLPEVVFAECVYTLWKPYGVDRVAISTQMSTILGYRGVVANRIPLLRGALAVYQSTKLSIVDALVLAYHRSEGLELVSFDKDLHRLASRTGESD